MKVEIFYVEGCPYRKPAVDRVQAVMKQQGLIAELAEIEVPDAEAAKVVGFLGSPTIRVNGLDVEPAARGSADHGFACRRYPSGLPSEDMIRTALLEGTGRERE